MNKTSPTDPLWASVSRDGNGMKPFVSTSIASSSYRKRTSVGSVAGFLGALVGPLINGSNQAIWQAKVAPDVQGRVFSVRRAIAFSAGLIAPLLAAPLVEGFAEALRRGGVPAKSGVFGAHMLVEIANDGPVTILLEA